MFEINLNALGVDAEAPTAEQLEAGAPELVHLQAVGGSALPLGDPQNPGRPMMFPSCAVNFALNKEAALGLAKLLEEKANELPDEKPQSGRIALANSMSDVERHAQEQARLTKR